MSPLTLGEVPGVAIRDLQAMGRAREVFNGIQALPKPVDPVAVLKLLQIPSDSPVAGIVLAVVLTMTSIKDIEALTKPLSPEGVLAALKIPAGSPISDIVGAVLFTIKEIQD